MLRDFLDGVMDCAASFVDGAVSGFGASLTEGPPNSPLFEDHSRKRRGSCSHSAYNPTGMSPKKRRLIERWQRLYLELYGAEGFLDEFQSCSAIRGAIDDLEAKRPLIRKWHRRYRETYGTKGYLHGGETSADLQRDIDNFIEIKPLWKECVRYFQSLGGNACGLSCHPSTPGGIQILMDDWYRAAVLEEHLRSGAHPAVCGTIVGYERRTDEMGFESWVFNIAADDMRKGILPLGALNRTVRNNVCQDFRRRTGKTLRNFTEAYRLYEGKRVRAKIKAMSDWRRDGVPKYEFEDGVVAGYEGRGMWPVPPTPGSPNWVGGNPCSRSSARS